VIFVIFKKSSHGDILRVHRTRFFHFSSIRRELFAYADILFLRNIHVPDKGFLSDFPKSDEFVKSRKQRYPREGGGPEQFENTGFPPSRE
jgi:hypothetical protein